METASFSFFSVRAIISSFISFLLFPLIIQKYLDRASLSNVHKSIIHDLHMQESQYADAVGIFFLGCIF